tara:strand:+ start:1266 stop:1478 length:213 start_codon:yes stop_codon:yes gene_type:complete
MAAKKSTTTKKVTSSISMPAKAEMRKWEIESAMNTLRRADEIRSNAKMMSDVKKLAQEQIKMLGGMVKGK